MKKRIIICGIIIVIAMITFLTYTTVRDRIARTMLTNIVNSKSFQKEMEEYAARSSEIIQGIPKPADNAGSATPQGNAQPATPQDNSQSAAPQDNAQPATPQDNSQSAAPQNNAQPATPQDNSQSAAPQNNAQPTTPQDNKQAEPSDTTSPATVSPSSGTLEASELPADFIGPPLPPKSTEQKTEPPQKKYKSFWDEPLVKEVYSRFSASEIAEVSAMSVGGFTAEERRRAKSIVYGKVSSSEIQRIQQLYNMYSGK